MKSMLISYNLYDKSCDFREKQSEPPGIVHLVMLQLHHTLIMHACLQFEPGTINEAVMLVRTGFLPVSTAKHHHAVQHRNSVMPKQRPVCVHGFPVLVSPKDDQKLYRVP